MADEMNFDLVSPERSIASFLATEVQLPGSEGDMTAMPNHAPILTTLRPGILSVSGVEGTMEYVVTGGFAEVKLDGVTVLAERATNKSSFTQEDMDSLVGDVKGLLDLSDEATKDSVNKTYADVLALAGTLGLGVA
jgi:F-type H+-transporting ATPase subunit epsilon